MALPPSSEQLSAPNTLRTLRNIHSLKLCHQILKALGSRKINLDTDPVNVTEEPADSDPLSVMDSTAGKGWIDCI